MTAFRRTWLLLALCPLLALPALASSEQEVQLWFAAQRGLTDQVKSLIENGVDVNARTEYGATALAYACDKGHVEIVRLLVNAGADVNVEDTFYKFTPIGWAGRSGKVEIIQMLLDKGVDKPAPGLMAAIFRGHQPAAELILSSVKLSPDELKPALELALQAQEPEIVALIEKALAEAEAPTEEAS